MITMIKREISLEDMFEDIRLFRYNDSKLRTYFDSDEWKRYDYKTKFDILTFYFSTLYYYTFNERAILEFIRQLEIIKAEMEDRRSIDIILNDNIFNIVDTNYESIFVSVKNFAALKMHGANIKAVYDFFRVHSLIRDYKNVEFNVDDKRTNEIKLNLLGPDFYLKPEENPILYYYQPIEYYARLDSDLETRLFYEHSLVFKQIDKGYEFFIESQRREALMRKRILEINGIKPEDAKQYVLHMLKSKIKN